MPKYAVMRKKYIEICNKKSMQEFLNSSVTCKYITFPFKILFVKISTI